MPARGMPCVPTFAIAPVRGREALGQLIRIGMAGNGQLCLIADRREPRDSDLREAEIARRQVQPVHAPEAADIGPIVLRKDLAEGAIESQAERVQSAGTDHPLILNDGIVSDVADVIAEPRDVARTVNIRLEQVLVAIAIARSQVIPGCEAVIHPYVPLGGCFPLYRLREIVAGIAQQVGKREQVENAHG